VKTPPGHRTATAQIILLMGKKHKRPAKDVSITQPKTAPQPRTIKKLWIRIILVAAVFVMYGNTINYEFTIDDNIFYGKHSSVQKGFSGIPETFAYGSLEKYNGMQGLQPYRPVTLTSFALQKELFNNDPAKAHLVNVVLYALLVLVLFNLLLKLLPAAHPVVCGIIVLLFAAHPVHTEVVASVKSQDELLSALFALLALSYAAGLIKEEKFSLKYSIISFTCFGLALLSKEGAFAMILIFPLTFWLLLSQSLKRSVQYSLPYMGAALLFLLARHMVLDGQEQNYKNTIMENVLYSATGFAEHTATRMEILFHYLRLSFIPWPLSWDYSYNQVPVVDWGSITAWSSLLLYSGMLVFAILKIKKKPVISFGILFYLIMLAPTANLFFLNGSTVSERFLFLPSLGLVLLIVYVLADLVKFNITSYDGLGTKKFSLISGLVILCFIGLTVSRSNDWQSNLSIYQAGVEHAPKSSRTNSALGNEYYKLAKKEANPLQRDNYFKTSMKYLNTSLTILPSNRDALYNTAVLYEEMGDKLNAKEAYRNTITYYPDHRSALNNLGTVFLEENKFDSAYTYLKRCYDVDSLFPKSSQNLAIWYFKSGNYNEAIRFATNAIRLDKYTLVSYDIIAQSYKALGNQAETEKYQKLYGVMAAEVAEVNSIRE
jgi:Tfp pilus assembly protein PilF